MIQRIRTYRTELDPTKAQIAVMEQTCRAVRYVYNAALEQRIMLYRQWGVSISEFTQGAELTIARDEIPWLSETSRSSQNAALQNLNRAYGSFFRRVKAGADAAGFPRFKSRHGDQGFKFFTSTVVTDRSISLPRVGVVRLKERGYLPTGSIKIKSGSVKLRAGRWFVTITVEEFGPIRTSDGPAIGVDFGVKALATCSNGAVFENPRALETEQKKIRRLQRKLERQRKTAGTANIAKTKAKIAKLHMRVANVRSNALHEVSHYVTANRRPAAVAIEDLNVSGMLRNGKLARVISDVGFAELRRQIEYKADWYGVEVVTADRFYPSSKTCSECGAVKQKLGLSERTFRCGECGSVMDRDMNAAKNLEKLTTANHAGSNACGDGRFSVEQSHAVPVEEAGTVFVGG